MVAKHSLNSSAIICGFFNVDIGIFLGVIISGHPRFCANHVDEFEFVLKNIVFLLIV